MKDCLMSIDAGTGGVRAVIFDAQGQTVSQAYRELSTTYAPDGRAEQDPLQLIDGACAAARDALESGAVDPAAVAGVGFCGAQTTFVPLDAQGRPVGSLILWQDMRGLEMFPWIRARLAERGLDEDALYRRTLKPLDAMLAGAKLLWLREREPEQFRRVRGIANPQLLLLRAFGAKTYAVDVTDGGWWLCHDGATLEADAALAEAFDLDPALFPSFCAPDALAGHVSAEAAKRTGLRAGTPLFYGAVDQCCAALGAGNAGSAGMGTLCLGTVGIVMRWDGRPRADVPGQLYTVRYPTGGFAHELAAPVAASAFRWVRDVLYPVEAVWYDGIYAHMDAEAAQVSAGSRGVAFLPQLAGCVYPKPNAAVRGGFVGLSMGTGRAELVRAALEGVAFEMRRLMEASGGGFDTLRLLGGASRSALWNQIQADIYGCPVETVAAQEASALGAAMIAASGAGVYSDIGEAVGKMTRVSRRYEPDPTRVAQYDDAYRAWLDCLEDLTPRAFPALANVRAPREGR